MERKRWNAVTEPGTAQHLDIEEMSWEQQGRLRGGACQKSGRNPRRVWYSGNQVERVFPEEKLIILFLWIG